VGLSSFGACHDLSTFVSLAFNDCALTFFNSMPSHSGESKPLPLSDTLRDLAVLRVSGIDLGRLSHKQGDLDAPQPEAQSSIGIEKEQVVQKSYEFAREARAAIQILNRGEVDKQGEKVDAVIDALKETFEGLGSA